MRLNYTTMSEEQIVKGVEILAEVIKKNSIMLVNKYKSEGLNMGEKENGIKFGKLMFQLVIIAISWELVYIIPFIQYTLYDPILKALECTNTQLGFLLTIYGLGNIFGAPIGGWLAR